MTPEQFCYWLQGYYELTNDTDRLSQRDHIIRDHLQTVFQKVTPTYTGSPITVTTPGKNYPEPWNHPGTTIC